MCINVTSFIMYLWRGNEVGEFWHFIETVLKKKENGGEKKIMKHKRAQSVDFWPL